MPLKYEEIAAMVEKDYDSAYEMSQTAANDRVFYFLTQNDDWILENTTLGYLGQFDLLRKAGRQIISDGEENPVQLDFVPVDDEREDGADLLDGMYRTDDNNNQSIEAYANGRLDQIVCGYGAWELYTEYSSLMNYEEDQVIMRRPISEAVSCVFWDANAKFKDKSDANRVVKIASYSEDGYRDYVSEMLDIDPEEVDMTSFKDPTRNETFHWKLTGSTEVYYIGNFFHRKKIKTKLITYMDPLGEERKFMENQVSEVMDELKSEGWKIIGEKTITTWEVRKYIVDGKEILNGKMGKNDEREGEVIAGIHLPIVPVYGEHTFINGEEFYEGFVRLAKDPQRLRNFVYNYLASLLLAPKSKAIYYPEQIAKFEKMYNQSGPDDDYPYCLMNSKDYHGQPLPPGPVGMTPSQEIPQAMSLLLPLTRESVEDVAPSMLPKEISDPSVQIASKTVAMMQSSISEQTTIYQVNFATAKRRDGEIYASMAAQINDTKKKVTLTKADGTRETIELMTSIIDEETGKTVILNDINNQEFKVISNIGPAYRSQKEQAIEKMIMLKDGMQPGDPKRTILELQIMSAIEGTDFKDFKAYARKELIMMGVKQPETDEEIAMMKQLQEQPKEKDAMMIAAEAELLKGQAEMRKNEVAEQENQIKLFVAKAHDQQETMKRMLEKFDLITKRAGVQVDADEAGAVIDYKRADTMSQQIDTAIEEMDDDALLDMAMGA